MIGRHAVRAHGAHALVANALLAVVPRWAAEARGLQLELASVPRKWAYPLTMAVIRLDWTPTANTKITTKLEIF